MIIFQNAGEADLTALTTFGVNVKETANPIGYFGTGFKYAVAVLLRTGHRVLLDVGRERYYEFLTESVCVRGQSVNVVVLNDNGARQPLGYTTDVGKNWQVWMAYRELWCNAHDEPEPRVFQVGLGARLLVEPGVTRVLVTPPNVPGPDGTIEDAHARRAEFLLQTRPLWANDELEIHPGPGRGIFYRGVRVYEHAKSALYTYNVLGRLDLTEDRTIVSDLIVRWRVESALLAGAPAELLEPALLARGRGTLEAGLDYSTCFRDPSPQFSEVMARLLQTRAAEVNPAAVARYETHHARRGALTWHEPTEHDAATLTTATTLARRCLPVDTFPIRVAQSLGRAVLGLARDGTIVLSRECLALGVGAVAGTLIEEYLHLAEGLEDNTRSMQNRLLNLLAAALGGSPAPAPEKEVPL